MVRISIVDRQFIAGSLVLLGLITLTMTALSGVFSLRIWDLGDTRIFYHMAEIVLQGGAPYVDFQDPKPPLIYFLLTLPLLVGHKFIGGLALVWLAGFISSAIILLIGWKLYGRLSGMVAAVLFSLNFAWAEGYFVLTEPFTVTFTLLSVYFLIFGPYSATKRYLIAGLAAGAAICFKQYALLLLPVSIFFMWRKKDYNGFLPYMAGAALSVALVFGAIFIVYGPAVAGAAIHWSFGIAGSYITSDSVEGVSAFKIDDPVIAMSWLVLGFSLFCSLFVMAAAKSFCKKLTCNEELFLLAAIAFAFTLAIRPFLHYWALPLPFVVLLAAPGFSDAAVQKAISASYRRIGDQVFYALAALPYAALIFLFAAISRLLMDNIWRPAELDRFYILGDIVLKATNPYLLNVPEPSLLSINMFSPGQGTAVGIAAVGIILFSTALLILKIGTKLGGRRAGFFSGILFVASVSWSVGFLNVSDALAVFFITAAVSVLSRSTHRRSILVAGFIIGMAVVLKPLSVLVLPAIALYIYRESGVGKATLSIAPSAVGLAVSILVGIIISQGGQATTPALAGIAINLVPLTIYTGGYMVTDRLVAMLNIVAGATLLTAVLPMAIAAIMKKQATTLDKCLLLSGALLLLTLPAGEYVHYWFMAVPLLSLPCALLLAPCPNLRR